MFNARRARYTETPLYRYYLHTDSVSRKKRIGRKNLEYQRHYIRITEALALLNDRYADRIPVYPEFRQQITYEAMRVCHAVKKEPDMATRQRMISDIFSSGMYWRMIMGVRSLKLAYQMLLWSARLTAWRSGALMTRRLMRRARGGR